MEWVPPKLVEEHIEITVYVPAIEVCFMSVDEIARIFLSPRAYIEGERSEFLPREKFGIFLSPYRGS